MSDVKYDAELCEQLARELVAAARTPHPPHLTSAQSRAVQLQKLGGMDGMIRRHDAMADQLAAARAEIGRLARYVEAQSRLLAENANVYHAMRRAHEAEVEALAATRREFDAYRAARDKAGK